MLIDQVLVLGEGEVKNGPILLTQKNLSRQREKNLFKNKNTSKYKLSVLLNY